MSAAIRRQFYGGKRLEAALRMNRAAAFGSAAKLYSMSGQHEEASMYAAKAAHEVDSPRMRKAIRRGGGGGDVTVRAYTRSRPSR